MIDYYVRMLSNADSLRGSFGWYRALDTTIAQDEQRKTQPLTMEEMLAALTAFLAPYRDRSAGAHDARPHAAA